MSGPLFEGDRAQRYRLGYLKLRSVLHDRTTDLPAVPLLFDPLRRLLDDRRCLGVLHVAIRELDTVESLYGWQVFDRIAARVAETLRAAIGHELPLDTRLAVNGVAGGTFLAFLPANDRGAEVDARFLSTAAEALCRRAEAAFDVEELRGLGPPLGCRVGYAMFTDDPFHRFERALYAAIESAAGADARRETRRERSWSEELRRIIQDGAVTATFQPIVDLRDGTLLGHEALTRGPLGLFESPRTMFALAERMGQGHELDRLCCETTLRAFAGLVVRGGLFVNLLPEGLGDGAWRDGRLPAALTAVGLEPADVVIELSTRSLHDIALEALAGPLAALRESGFGLALDDVGTGPDDHATIAALRPNFLKLDGSLVRDLDRNLIKQEVLATLVREARAIDAEVIAESIESEAEALAVAASGARYGQGYHFAVPAEPGRGAPMRRRQTGY